jgi:membrane-bound ClpP family serine protease
MTPLVWILLLLVVGLALIMLEVFVPSGGVLGLLAVLALGSGVVLAFVEQGMAAGLGALAGVSVAVPIVLVLAFQWFPATPLGRRVLPQPPQAEDVLPDAGHRQRLRGLVGRGGRAASELVPWGGIEVAGEPFEAVSEGEPIAVGTEVEVVGVQGRALVVRVRAVAPAKAGPAPAIPAAPADGQPEPAGERGLSSLLEEFDFEEVRQNMARPDSLDRPPSANQA